MSNILSFPFSSDSIIYVYYLEVFNVYYTKDHLGGNVHRKLLNGNCKRLLIGVSTLISNLSSNFVFDPLCSLIFFF